MTIIEERFYNAVISLSNKICDRLANKIDWEQRRYEIASGIYKRCDLHNEDCAKDSAEFAVRSADLLIEELKKEK